VTFHSYVSLPLDLGFIPSIFWQTSGVELLTVGWMLIWLNVAWIAGLLAKFTQRQLKQCVPCFTIVVNVFQTSVAILYTKQCFLFGLRMLQSMDIASYYCEYFCSALWVCETKRALEGTSGPGTRNWEWEKHRWGTSDPNVRNDLFQFWSIWLKTMPVGKVEREVWFWTILDTNEKPRAAVL